MPLSQALPPHKTTHENGGADEIDATGLTGAGGGGGGGGWEEVSTYGAKLAAGRDTVLDQNEDAYLYMDGGGDIELTAGAAGLGSVSLFPSNSGIVDVGSGNGVRMPRLAADPASPATGQTYYNTVSNKLRCWDGTAWQVLW
jgi:hypothetical protein